MALYIFGVAESVLLLGDAARLSGPGPFCDRIVLKIILPFVNRRFSEIYRA
jgi:hypothetical protein